MSFIPFDVQLALKDRQSGNLLMPRADRWALASMTPKLTNRKEREERASMRMPYVLKDEAVRNRLMTSPAEMETLQVQWQRSLTSI